MTIPAKLSCIAFALLLLASCATSVPPWGASPAAMQQVFPDSDFIARQGRGATRDSAEANGSAAIAAFFNTEVVSRIEIAQSHWEANGSAQTVSRLESELFVQSQMQLAGVRHTHDAWFDRNSREWVTVAYINRAEAWEMLLPRIRLEAQTLARLYEAAEAERDPFRRALRFIAAQNHARSADFQNAQNMGELLSPARMNAEFAEARTLLALLPRDLDDARRNAPVFIDIPLDFESIVQSAFSRRFAELGFPVAANRNAAAAVCVVTIEEGRQQRELGVFYYPRVLAVVSSPAGTLLTFSAEGGRQAAVTPDVARRAAYQALAERVIRDFSLAASF